MEFLNNITESVGDIGAMAEGLNPAEELTAQAEELTTQAEELTGGIADTATQATEGIGDTLGGLFN
ncbi:MAG TPA: hypothetical protein PKC05_04465 [Candidatus Saccharibacteria bacterium]|nr:hypothetical protein [Candidatus Saccharibacteria bacterium]